MENRNKRIVVEQELKEAKEELKDARIENFKIYSTRALKTIKNFVLIT